MNRRALLPMLLSLLALPALARFQKPRFVRVFRVNGDEVSFEALRMYDLFTMSNHPDEIMQAMGDPYPIVSEPDNWGIQAEVLQPLHLPYDGRLPTFWNDGTLK